MLQYASCLKAWAHKQAATGQAGCEVCGNCPCKFLCSSLNAKELTPIYWDTHHGVRAGWWTVTVGQLTHCKSTPLLSSLLTCLCNHTHLFKARQARGGKSVCNTLGMLWNPPRHFARPINRLRHLERRLSVEVRIFTSGEMVGWIFMIGWVVYCLLYVWLLNGATNYVKNTQNMFPQQWLSGMFSCS